MVKIPLISFIDFINSSGKAKLSKVWTVKRSHDSGAIINYFGPLKKGVVDYHKGEEREKRKLDSIFLNLSEDRIKRRYEEAIRGYKIFLGRRDVKWFDPAKTFWNIGGMELIINPELGLIIDGNRYVIKMYLRREPLPKISSNTIILILYQWLHDLHPYTRFGVLDVLRGKMFSQESADMELLPLIKGEALSFKTMYEQIDVQHNG